MNEIEKICKEIQCPHFVVWNFGYGDCISCKLQGESYDIESVIFIAIGIAFMYVGIRICRDVWLAHEWLLVFAIGLCFVFMAIKQLM